MSVETTQEFRTVPVHQRGSAGGGSLQSRSQSTSGQFGAEGRRWALNEGGLNSKNMGQTFIDGMEYVFQNWSKPKKFSLHTVADYVGNKMPDGHMGFTYDKINTAPLLKRIEEINI